MKINEVVEVDPEKMSGVPCFTGTCADQPSFLSIWRVAETLDEFLDQFPLGHEGQALKALELSKESRYSLIMRLL